MAAKSKATHSTHAPAPGVSGVRRPFFHRKTETRSAPAPFIQALRQSQDEPVSEGVQRKLVAGQPGDVYEREADAIADAAVGRSSLSPAGPALAQRVTPLRGARTQAKAEDDIQAKAEEDEQVQAKAEDEEQVQAKIEGEEQVQTKAEGEEQVQTKAEGEEQVQAKAEDEEQVQTKAEDEEQVQTEVEDEEQVQAKVEDEEQVQAKVEDEEQVQAKAEDEEQAQSRAVQSQGEYGRDRSEIGLSAAGIQDELRARQGEGQRLPVGARGELELSFGADFSGVRIHTDDPAVQLTRMLHAQAFTQGSDIYFNAGRFDPTSANGRHLLAHELTHTLQQGATAQRGAVPSATLHHSGPSSAVSAVPSAVQRQADEESTILVRPELLDAIKLARGEIGKVNAKKTNADNTRLGWERLSEYFLTAFGGKQLIHGDIIKYIKKVQDQQGMLKDPMPSWCGIFVWWSYKQAGIPIPDWKLGVSILGWVNPRKPGELPHKGDIAYRHTNQHFALVTGVESPASAAGKDFKSIRVATINGNTSGEDNLGGQIEEKWEPISRWDGFFDPVAKLDMPPAALVQTGVEPDQAAAEPEGAATAAETAAVAETAPTDVSHLEEEIVTPAEPPAEGEASIPLEPLESPPAEPEPDLELPPRPAAPAEEEVAKPEPLALEGPSEQAMESFTSASPSQMAATNPVLGEKLSDKVEQEQQHEAEKAPVLVARTSGKLEEGLTPPDQIPVPGDAQIGDGVTGPESEDLTAAPHENHGDAPSNEASERELDERDEGGLLSWLRDNFTSFLNAIRTKDPGLNTAAGARPNVALAGDADPGRMASQREDASSQLVAQRDAATTAFKNHPGQGNIQPREVNEEKKAALSSEAPVPIKTTEATGASDYVNAALPADVRAKADDLLEPGVSAGMAKAQTETQTAAQKREDDKATEISNAEKEAAKINAQADKDQRDIVVNNRKEVASQQKQGIEDAYGHVNDFNTEADKEQVAARKGIGDKVKTAESEARSTLDKGEEDAKKKKVEGEKEAESKKEELEKEEEKGDWWDWPVNAIKKAVKAITSAIDEIFTKIRAAVKDIIEKAKQLAVDAINAARDWVVDTLNKFRDWAKGMVDTYLKERFPGLAKFINDGIDTVVDTAIDGVNFVADTAIAGVEALAKGLAAALDKILEIYQTALKAAVQIAGAVVTGDFAEALRIAIQAACDIAGVDSKPIFDFIDRAAAQVMNILKHPKEFFNNLMDAVAGGVNNFVKNIKKHLIGGLIGWLTGALSEVAITIPETFDLKAAFSLVMQILGLTYANIKAKIIKKFPPAATAFTVIEKGLSFVQKLVTEGPAALWEEAKAALGDLKQMVLDGIRGFVISTVIKEGITWLLSLLNPAAAIVKLVKLLFDFVMFLVERFEQIKDFVMSVYNSIAAIAAGSLGPAMQAVEDALARSLPVVISLLANLAGLGGIGKTVQNIIGKISKPVQKVVDKIVDKVVAFAKKVLAKVKGAAKKAKEAVSDWWKAKTSFVASDGATHRLYFKGKGKGAQLMVASTEGPYSAFISNLKIDTSDAKAQTAKTKAIDVAKKIDITKKKPGDTQAEIESLLKTLGTHTAVLFGKAKDLPASEISYSTDTALGEVVGKEMTAKILTKTPPASGEVGSSPTQAAHAVYDRLY